MITYVLRVCIYIQLVTWKLPRVIAIKIKKSNELNVEALALNLTAKVELYKFFLSRVEAKARHHHVVLMLIIIITIMMMIMIMIGLVGFVVNAHS